ncbi:MAG: thioredoxin family protein [Flavobacteriales bacterium]|jgi:protein disulfide-isomerase|nr:thioredoxin family protein [Flavobacteriales bacterium]MBT6815403.1 thioredoxin family protein [Flavobacteriales bacterium]
MKKLILLLFTIVSFTSFSQLIEGNWLNTEKPEMNKAIEISQKTNKPIMLFFTGSDWCGWCKKLVKEVYKTSEFNTWARKNVVLVEVDFPRRNKLSSELTAQNNSLKQIFQPRGYPTVYFAKPVKGADGNVQFKTLGQTGYVAGGPTKWIASTNQFFKK